MPTPKLAIVTGASTGIGLELAKLAAAEGYDLIVAADTPLVDAGAALKGLGVDVQSVEADLATEAGVKQLLDAAGDRPIDVLVANAGHGLGHAFLAQAPKDWMHVINTNITGTLLLMQPVLRQMVERGEGKILVVGSIAGHLAGSFQAVYNGSKAFIDSFTAAIRNEVKDSGVTHLPQARRDRDRVLRARWHGRHQGRPGQEGRSRRCRQDWLGRDEQGRGVSRSWAHEQGTGYRLGRYERSNDR